jgi:hypothetical protein
MTAERIDDLAAAKKHVRELLEALGPDYASTVEARRARDSARKGKERRRQTPEQTERERKRQQQVRVSRKPRPFLAIDGEGGGMDAWGRQPYLLMVAADGSGEKVCIRHNKGEALTAADCCLSIAAASQPAPAVMSRCLAARAAARTVFGAARAALPLAAYWRRRLCFHRVCSGHDGAQGHHDRIPPQSAKSTVRAAGARCPGCSRHARAQAAPEKC